MGADLSTTCKCTVSGGFLQVSDDDTEITERTGAGGSPCCISQHSIRPLGTVPALLHVAVPKGPTWISGLYRLVSSARPNGLPLWKAVYTDLWMYSMTNGKWGIGGRKEFEAGFEAGAAFVFCDSPHGGLMPHVVPPEWLHNKPAWTLDRSITIEAWEETHSVTLEKRSVSDRYGMQLSIVDLEDEEEKDLAGEFLPDLFLGHHSSSASEWRGAAEWRDAVAGAGAGGAGGLAAAAQSVLRLHVVAEGSLLARWNERMLAAGRRSEVVAEGSDIVRVNQEVDPVRMQAALLEEPYAEIVVGRPTGRGVLVREAAPEAAEAAAAAADEGAEEGAAAEGGEAVERVEEEVTPACGDQESAEAAASTAEAPDEEETRAERPEAPPHDGAGAGAGDATAEAPAAAVAAVAAKPGPVARKAAAQENPQEAAASEATGGAGVTRVGSRESTRSDFCYGGEPSSDESPLTS